MISPEIDIDETDQPPTLGIFDAPRVTMEESEFYDQWGNLKGPAEKIISEHHGENFIKIFIYKYVSISTAVNDRGADYHFGFQIKLDKLIRQKAANIADPPMRGVDEARIAAQRMIIDICKKNHTKKRVFADFSIMRYNQQELF